MACRKHLLNRSREEEAASVKTGNTQIPYRPGLLILRLIPSRIHLARRTRAATAPHLSPSRRSPPPVPPFPRRAATVPHRRRTTLLPLLLLLLLLVLLQLHHNLHPPPLHGRLKKRHHLRQLDLLLLGTPQDIKQALRIQQLLRHHRIRLAERPHP